MDTNWRETAENPLLYADENDRALGLTGMTIALAVYNAGDMLARVSLDDAPGTGFVMSPEFDFGGNPRMSARLVWQQLVHQFEIESAILVGNAMCRMYVGQRKRIPSRLDTMIRAMVRDHGHALCSLDDDEVAVIYEKIERTLENVFLRERIHTLAHTFADRLLSARTISGAEAIDILNR